MLHRGYKISSTRTSFFQEVDRLRKIFSNNNYPMQLIDECIDKYINKIDISETSEEQKRNKIPIYYQNQTLRNTLRTRLQQHCKDGAIKEHNSKIHNTNTTQDDLEANTLPMKQFQDLHRLRIYEALSILHERPDLNRQKDNFVNPLKLYSRSLHRTTPIIPTQSSQTLSSTQHTYNLRSNSN